MNFDAAYFSVNITAGPEGKRAPAANTRRLFKQ